MKVVSKTQAFLNSVRRRLLRQADYKSVFETTEGQEVLRHICQEAFMFRSTFVAGDPYQSALNEGTRRLALSILREVIKDPRELQTFVEESIKHATEISEAIRSDS
jgi:hypothetical protein